MDQAAHNKIVSFIWCIADDVLRDLFVRGKYRDVILPMTVLRRLEGHGLVEDFPNLAAYVARGEARPAYRRAFAAQRAVFDAGRNPR